MPSRSTSSSRSTTTTTNATPKPRARATTSATRTPKSTVPAPPSHDEIARLAHELYVQSGFQAGREVEFWLEAEKRLQSGLQLR